MDLWGDRLTGASSPLSDPCLPCPPQHSAEAQISGWGAGEVPTGLAPGPFLSRLEMPPRAAGPWAGLTPYLPPWAQARGCPIACSLFTDANKGPDRGLAGASLPDNKDNEAGPWLQHGLPASTSQGPRFNAHQSNPGHFDILRAKSWSEAAQAAYREC